MSTQYKFGDRVPSNVLCRRLLELSAAATKGPRSMEMEREFTMRIPAELDRDADLVISAAARRIEELESSRTSTVEQKSCQWASCAVEDDYHDAWEGSCGATWTFFEDGPIENDMHFCPKCGGSVAIQRSKVDSDAGKTE